MALKKSTYSSVDELPDLLQEKKTDYKSVDELPDLKKKSSGGVNADIGGTVGSSKAPSSVSIEPPNPKDNPFGIGQQFNKPPKLEAEKLDLSNTQHNAAIAEQIKTPLKKIPLTPILDNTKMEKPITEIDKREAEKKYKQHQIDMETAIDNTTLKVLKQKGIVAGKGSPYYEAERKKIEEKTKPTMIGGIVVNGAEATYHKDKDGNIGLDRNLGFLEGIRKGFNSAVEGEDEANAFVEMDTKQKVEFANKKMQENPNPEYMEERTGVGELVGGALPYLTRATFAATTAAAAGIAAPASGGASLVGLAPVLTVLLTAPDMIKQGQKDEVMTRYMQLKQENPFSKDEDLMKIAEEGEISGAIVGAAEALAFTTTLKLPIAKESKDVLTNYMKGVASSAVHLGGIMSGTTAAKIAERKLEGYNVDTDKAIDEITTAFTENATAGAILNGIISGAHILPKVVKSAFKYALKDTPTSEIKTALQANVEAGRIPPEVAEKTIADIEGYKAALAKTADGLKPETQASVAGLIQARDNVATEMATKDPTQRAVYEQKIEAYNKQIEKITETNDPLKYEIDEVTGNPIDKVAPKVEDTKLSEPIEGVDEQGIPIGDNVPTPTEVSGKDVVVDEGVGKDALKDVKSTTKALDNIDYVQEGIEDADIRLGTIESLLKKARKDILDPEADKSWDKNHYQFNLQLLSSLIAERKDYENIKKENAERDFTEMQGIPPKDENGKFIKNGKEYSDYIDRAILPNLNKNIDNFKNYIAEAYHKSKADGSNPELVKAVEQSLSTPKGKEVVQPSNVWGEGVVDKTEAKTKLEKERDAEIDKVSKPDLKLELVKTEDLVNSKDPIGNREKHNELKERYKNIRKLLDCL